MRGGLHVLAVAGLCVAGLGLVNCGDDEASDPVSPVTYSVVGLWETDFPETSSVALWYQEFRADSTMLQGSEVNAMSQVGTWVMSHDTLTTFLTVPATVTVRGIVVFTDGGQSMTVTPLGGQPIPFVRVSQ